MATSVARSTEQVSTQRYRMKIDERLALYLATLPEVKTNAETGERSTSEELPAISQQVSYVAEGREGQEVTATTAIAMPLVTEVDPGELLWSISRSRYRGIRRRPGPNEPENISRNFISL
jgi:hypothetical protein